jgi:hypothetical protein
LSTTGNGRLPIRKRITGHRAAPRAAGTRRREDDGMPPHDEGRRWNETLSSAAVILAGVLVVVGFGFAASRAMRSHSDAPNVAVPEAPALGEVTLPSSPASQGLIQLTSPSVSPSSSPPPTSPSAEPTTKAPPPDPGALTITTGAVPGKVDLSAEGSRDWVHWGEQSTFSLERDKNGGFAILEGAPTAPRFRHALSPQRFSWTGGDPVDHTDGTTTGIRTCGKGNGFSISAPAGDTTRTLKLYVGVISGKGRLSAKLSTGSATASTTLQQNDGTFHTAVLTLRYRAPKDGKITLRWNTDDAFGTGCGGVALEAATLR